MRYAATTATALTALGALLTPAAATAAIDFGQAPSGFTVIDTVTGSQATPRNASRWFEFEGTEGVRTNWANEAITFSTSNLPTDTYSLGITATNFGDLASNYSNFKVDVRVNGSLVQANAPIAASSTQWNTLWLAVGELTGDADVKLKWRNDSYRPGVYDANIVFGGVQFAASSVPAPGGVAVAMLAGAAVLRRRR